jgi:hypothetical protein
MYPLILSFETINKLKLFFEWGNSMPQDAGTPWLALLQFVKPILLSPCLRTGPVRQGYRKESRFPGGNRTQATCLASSVARRSAIHYVLAYMILGFEPE